MASATSIADLKSVAMLAVCVCFLSLTWFVVSLRIYVRAYMIRSFGWDDWTMIATQMLFSIFCVMIILISVVEITGDMTDDSTIAIIVTYMVSVFGLYIITAVVFKISLAIFFLRVVNEKWQRQVIYACVFIYSFVGTAWFFVALFQCGSPLDFIKNTEAGKCLDWKSVMSPFNYFHGVLNAVTDWVFAIVPIFVVRSAQMTRKARGSVMAILALGAAGSIASVVRLGYVNMLGVGSAKIFFTAPDYAIVSVIELGLGITAGSLATLRPLFSRFIDKATTAMSSSRNKKGRKPTTTGQSYHGIVMERSVNVGWEDSHELETMPSPMPIEKGYAMDSGIASIASPTHKHFSIVAKSGAATSRVSEMMSTISVGNDSEHKRDSRSQSQDSSVRSLLYIDRSS